jgi:hypothetical protein
MAGYLPEWLDPGTDLFVDSEHWRILYGLSVDPAWSESWQRGLLHLLKMEPEAGRDWARPEADVLACVLLLQYTGIHKRTGKPLTSRTASIKHSLKDQLIEWLETPESERTFDSPFSPKQWNKCLRSKYNAYYDLRKRGARIVDFLTRLIESGEIWPESVTDLVPRYEIRNVTDFVPAYQA